MLEQLDYLIRTLTYKRSSLECDLRKIPDGIKMEFTELYKMVSELTKYGQ